MYLQSAAHGILCDKIDKPNQNYPKIQSRKEALWMCWKRRRAFRVSKIIIHSEIHVHIAFSYSPLAPARDGLLGRLNRIAFFRFCNTESPREIVQCSRGLSYQHCSGIIFPKHRLESISTIHFWAQENPLNKEGFSHLCQQKNVLLTDKNVKLYHPQPSPKSSPPLHYFLLPQRSFSHYDFLTFSYIEKLLQFHEIWSAVKRRKRKWCLYHPFQRCWCRYSGAVKSVAQFHPTLFFKLEFGRGETKTLGITYA